MFGVHLTKRLECVRVRYESTGKLLSFGGGGDESQKYQNLQCQGSSGRQSTTSEGHGHFHRSNVSREQDSVREPKSVSSHHSHVPFRDLFCVHYQSHLCHHCSSHARSRSRKAQGQQGLLIIVIKSRECVTIKLPHKTTLLACT